MESVVCGRGLRTAGGASSCSIVCRMVAPSRTDVVLSCFHTGTSAAKTTSTKTSHREFPLPMSSADLLPRGLSSWRLRASALAPALGHRISGANRWCLTRPVNSVGPWLGNEEAQIPPGIVIFAPLPAVLRTFPRCSGRKAALVHRAQRTSDDGVSGAFLLSPDLIEGTAAAEGVAHSHVELNDHPRLL